jgi:hypothetical protein
MTSYFLLPTSYLIKKAGRLESHLLMVFLLTVHMRKLFMMKTGIIHPVFAYSALKIDNNSSFYIYYFLNHE